VRALSPVERQRRTDLLAIAALLAVYLAWALLLASTSRYCNSDCVVEMLPRLLGVVRPFQSGELAWWDPRTFAGGKPFWETFGGLYYPLFLPLYLLADPNDPHQAAPLLHLAPYVLHLAWAATGTYLFARRVVGLGVAAALIAALAFCFSPPMLEIALVNQLRGYSYLPWILWAAVRFLDSGSRRAWAGGAGAVAAMAFASNPDHVNRTLFLVGLNVAGVLLLARPRLAATALLRRAMALLAMVIVGLGSYAFGLVGIMRGITSQLKGVVMACPQVATYAPYSSAPPSSYLGALFPGAFVEREALVSAGGILLLAGVSYAVVSAARERSEVRRWTLISIGVGLFSVLVTLGHHTPVFNWLCTILPPFLGFPHPARYALGVCWSMALLAGIGVSKLTAEPWSIPRLTIGGWAAVMAAIVLAAGFDIPYFRRQPIVDAALYVAAATVVLVVALAVPAGLRGRVIAAGIFAELALTAIAFPLGFPRPEAMKWDAYPTWSLARNPADELRPMLRRFAGGGEYRFVGSRSFIDNQAWLVDGRGLFGMMPVPIFPRFERAFTAFTRNAPNDLWLSGLPWFLPNMNVRYLIADRHPQYHEYMQDGCTAWDEAVATLPSLDRTANFEVREIAAALPFAYLQDRVAIADSEVQYARLMHTDLREAAYVEARFAVAHPQVRTVAVSSHPGIDRPLHPCQIDDRSIVPVRPLGDAAVRFEELQRASRILGFDRSRPNHKRFDVQLDRSAMLVIAENWHPDWRATVDGAAAEVWQINYLQQGVWLEAGRHEVQLEYRPVALRDSALASFASWLVIAMVALVRRPA